MRIPRYWAVVFDFVVVFAWIAFKYAAAIALSFWLAEWELDDVFSRITRRSLFQVLFKCAENNPKVTAKTRPAMVGKGRPHERHDFATKLSHIIEFLEKKKMLTLIVVAACLVFRHWISAELTWGQSWF